MGKGKRERIGRILEMHAKDREERKMARAGDIIAVVGLKDTTTGDTLCDASAPMVLERMDFPEPVIKVSIEPKTKADLDKMGMGLNKLAAEDPSFTYARDDQTGQTVIAGMGELHLEIIVDRLKREFKVECNVGEPQVNYREAISKTHEVRYTHKKQSGGSGQFSDIKGGVVPKEYIPGVAKGLESCMDSGPIAGFPVCDMRATLFDGSYHDVDSSVLAFEIAARNAFKEGVLGAGPQLTEPIMKVEVITPEESMGDVIGDLNSRRGLVDKLGERPGA